MKLRLDIAGKALLFSTIVLALLVALVTTAVTPAHAAPLFGKSHLHQDPKFLAAKFAGKIHPNGVLPAAVPSAVTLDKSVVGNTMEPPPSGYDDGCFYSGCTGAKYTDGNFAGFCAEGATTVALTYWGQSTNSWGSHTYTDPGNSVTTTWQDEHNRSYLMHLAIESKPPTWGSAGEYDFVKHTTAQPDIRDVLNWEASGHSTSWATKYYGLVWAHNDPNKGNMTASQLNYYITSDIGNDGEAVVVDVNAKYLTASWKTTNTINHNIAIIGYDNNASLYTYVDTCGGILDDTSHATSVCNGTVNYAAGVHTISQQQLYNGIWDNPYSNGQTGAIIW